MSVAGVSPGSEEAEAPRAVQPVAAYDPTTGDPVASGAAIAAIGSPDDAAWSGTGDATVISLLKAIATNTAA